MSRLPLAAAVLAVGVLTAGGAMAAQCPANVKAIDAALASNMQYSSMQKEEAMALRDKGDALHKSGGHADAMAALTKAKEILGIK
jgi:hypothetical protein